MRSGFRNQLLFLLLVAALFCGGCHRRPKPLAPRPQTISHQVKFNGETLSLISLWYTGRSENWQAIARANPGVAPSKLAIGTVLSIPSNLAVKSKSFDSAFIAKRYRLSRSSPASLRNSVDTTGTGNGEQKKESDSLTFSAATDEAGVKYRKKREAVLDEILQ